MAVVSGYTGPFARDWKPRNLGGSIYYDPRDELAYWADSTDEPMVAVPVATLRAAAELRVCRASTVSNGDEDGPFTSPVTLHCKKAEGHRGDHFNGYASWSERDR